jgi:hypothetical protein
MPEEKVSVIAYPGYTGEAGSGDIGQNANKSEVLRRRGLAMKCSTQTFLGLRKKTMYFGLLILIFSQPYSTIAQQTIPLSISLESYAYSYPVKLFPLTVEGQDLKMAYMDIPIVTCGFLFYGREQSIEV